MMRLIDADDLVSLCHMMADTVDGLGKSIWRQFASMVQWNPTVDAIPVEWIEKYAVYDDRFGSIYRMIEEWRNSNAER